MIILETEGLKKKKISSFCLTFQQNGIKTTMLCQNHQKIIKGFMGQTTSFKEKYIKKNVTILGENKSLDEAKYIHGKYGNGTDIL